MLSAESLAKIDFEVSEIPAGAKAFGSDGCTAHCPERKRLAGTGNHRVRCRLFADRPVAAYEVATFYNMYDRKPVGKHKLTVCTNLPCALSGGVDAGKYLQQKLGIGYGETTADGKFTLVEGECMRRLRRRAGHAVEQSQDVQLHDQ